MDVHQLIKLYQISLTNMYYHISLINHNGETFRPRIPNVAECDGDTKHKRVCFSSSIKGAIEAIHDFRFDTGYWTYYYVHIPDNYIGKIITPTPEQVFDVNDTKEKWFTSNVKLKCIGIIKAKYDNQGKQHYRWLIHNN